MIRMLGVLILLALTGCARQGEAPEPATVQTGEALGTTVRREIDAASIDATATLSVRTIVTFPPGGEPEIEAPDYEGAGWTLAATSERTAPAHEGAGIVLTRTDTLEPYLEGVYTIPEARVLVPADTGSPVEITLDELDIEVTITLPDEADLVAAGQVRVPDLHTGTPSTAFMLAVGVLGGVCLAGALGTMSWALTRKPAPGRDPAADLRAALDDERTEPETICVRARRVLDTVEDARADRLARQLELLRFSPADPPKDKAMALAHEALALHTPDPEASA